MATENSKPRPTPNFGHPTDRRASNLALSADTAGTACLLTVEGVLDSSTYLQLRDAIVAAALNEPQAVLVDVNGLDVPASSAWAVFTSARWLVDTWPDIPIHLVCGNAGRHWPACGQPANSSRSGSRSGFTKISFKLPRSWSTSSSKTFCSTPLMR
jgi:hypothetical protein